MGGCYLTAKSPQKPLILTTTNKHGDCVSSGIDTAKSSFEITSDQQQCAENHPQDSAARNACIQHVSVPQTVRSLINYCGAENSPYFIGINGITYALEKSDANKTQHPYFIGLFKGKQLTVRVTNLGLISKTYQDGSPQTDDNIEQIKFNVQIDVVLDGARASFNGVLDEGI